MLERSQYKQRTRRATNKALSSYFVCVGQILQLVSDE